MIYIGADHRGFKLKESIKKFLSDNDYIFEDVGAFQLDPADDYPGFAKKVAERIIDRKDRGIIICGSGVGVDDVANKFSGVRSGLAINEDQIKAARNDDDINVLSLASDYISEDQAIKIVGIFLETEFSGEERHSRRIKEINKIENNNG